MFSVRTLQ